jgi:hypothetical protein
MRPLIILLILGALCVCLLVVGVSGYFLLKDPPTPTPTPTPTPDSNPEREDENIELKWQCSRGTRPYGIISTNEPIDTELDELESAALDICQVKYPDALEVELIVNDLKKDYKCELDGEKYSWIKEDTSKEKYKCLTSGDNKCVEYDTKVKCLGETKDFYTSYTKECGETDWSLLCTKLYGTPESKWDTSESGTWGPCEITGKIDGCPSPNYNYSKLFYRKGERVGTKCIKAHGSDGICKDPPPIEKCVLKPTNLELALRKNEIYCPIDATYTDKITYGDCINLSPPELSYKSIEDALKRKIDVEDSKQSGTSRVTRTCNRGQYGGVLGCDSSKSLIRIQSCTVGSSRILQKKSPSDEAREKLANLCSTIADTELKSIDKKECIEKAWVERGESRICSNIDWLPAAIETLKTTTLSNFGKKAEELFPCSVYENATDSLGGKSVKINSFHLEKYVYPYKGILTIDNTRFVGKWQIVINATDSAYIRYYDSPAGQYMYLSYTDEDDVVKLSKSAENSKKSWRFFKKDGLYYINLVGYPSYFLMATSSLRGEEAKLVINKDSIMKGGMFPGMDKNRDRLRWKIEF